MKTLRHDKDGVIVCTDSLQMDPMGTRARVKELMDASDIAGQVLEARKALQLIPHTEKAAIRKAVNEYRALLAEFRTETLRIRNENIVYFEPRVNEIPLTEVLAGKLRKLKSGEKLTIDGKVAKG